MRRSTITLMCVALGFATAISAQVVADFSGTWVLNPDKGENLGMVAAIKQTVVIAQTEEQLSLGITSVFQGNESTRTVRYDLEGQPVMNEAAMGAKSETASQWADGKLITTWTSEGAIAGSEVVRTETRTLSEDGKTMTVSTARGTSPAMVTVFEKQ